MVTIAKSGANLAALEVINADLEAPIRIRQSSISITWSNRTSGDQATNAADAGIEKLSLCPDPSDRH
jgi:hypothetical protein